MKIEFEELKSIMFGMDWIEILKNAYENRRSSWFDLGHIKEWRNATDEILFACWKQLEEKIKEIEK